MGIMTKLQPGVAPAEETLADAASAYRITAVTDVTDRAALDALLLEYYGVIVQKIIAAGISADLSPSGLKASFWPNLHKILPPTGRLLLVHDAADRLVGCATMHQIRPDAGEFKRLYIRPEANGNGLGRRLVLAQMEAARSMGWHHLLVNIIKGNRESIRIFEGLGFHYIDRYPECSDPLEADPWFVYMQRDLT
jgi:GNAT superfamily N-acetyltransferase